MTDPLTAALAETLAREPGMAEHLLRAHVDDGSGRCAGCSTDTTRASWPCSIAWHVSGATGAVLEVVVPGLSDVVSGPG